MRSNTNRSTNCMKIVHYYWNNDVFLISRNNIFWYKGIRNRGLQVNLMTSNLMHVIEHILRNGSCLRSHKRLAYCIIPKHTCARKHTHLKFLLKYYRTMRRFLMYETKRRHRRKNTHQQTLNQTEGMTCVMHQSLIDIVRGIQNTAVHVYSTCDT